MKRSRLNRSGLASLALLACLIAGPVSAPIASASAQNQNSANASGADDASAAGWPFIRGPHYDGHSSETGLIDAWPSQGPPVLWVRELGQGFSSFVAAGDRIYTQMQTLTGQCVVCLASDTGETIWQYRYDWPYEAFSVYPGPRATPTLYRDRVYFAAPSGLIGCLTAEDGKRLWSVNVKERFDGKGTGFGYACSPLVIDNKVILPVGGQGACMLALDATNGSVVWRSGDEPASYVPAFPITLAGQRQVVGYLQNCLMGCDLKTGKQLWRWDLSQGYDEHAAWPVYSEPYLWFAGPFRSGSQLLKLNRDTAGKISVESVWKSQVLSNDVASSVLVDGFLYGFDIRDQQAKTHRPSRGRFCCVEFLMGEERWSVDSMRPRRNLGEAAETGEIGHATVRVADGKLILFNDTGELILARPNPERYEELARIRLLGGEIVWTVPLLHQGRLYVRNHSRAACVLLAEPDQLTLQGPKPVLTAADIPQEPYRDLAAAILRIEPEYAFDVPTMGWFRDWYWISLIGLMGPSFVVTVLAWFASRRRLSGLALRWCFWLQALLLGALGTTALSEWRDVFVFTWPLCLFAAFQVTVYEVRSKRSSQQAASSRWRSGSIVFGFLAVSLAYFLLCRRLSLVFEWAFLAGFLPALPFAVLAAHSARKSIGPVVVNLTFEIIWTVAAFSAFYWSAVALLFGRC